MARTDTLGNFLTDVAEAIRTKEGTTETIPASEFDTRISNLSGGGSEDLSEELDNYNIGLNNQVGLLNDILTTVENKAFGEGEPVGQPDYFVYDPRALVKTSGEVTEISDDLQLGSGSNFFANDISDTTLVFWTMSKYDSCSDNINIIFESDMYPSSTMKLYIGYIKSTSRTETFTLKRQATGTISYGIIPLKRCGIPRVVNSYYVETDSSGGSYDMVNDGFFNIFIFGSSYTTMLSNNIGVSCIGNFATYTHRVGAVIMTCPVKGAKLSWNNLGRICIAQVRCPVDMEAEV